jgi:two-component system, NarL family, sensor histidine kinase LiaS
MAQSPRVEIAQEIHDGIAQDLVALGYELDLVLAAPLTPAVIRNDVRTIRFRVSALIEKVRGEIYDLRKQAEFDTQLRDVVFAISPTIEIAAEEVELTDTDRHLLLRVIPELLRNAHIHSGASQIHLQILTGEDGVMVKVSDNGRGGAIPTSGRYGLLGSIERVKDHGASIEIDSRKEGTTITITL